ncbi:RAMP superfamily CRISPR-associated protein [Pseudotabrizicola sp. 4114]|uniref:RAMP superfamily CRISPR-associated protein n=1 Tax=Pseudotabrizicola sp. 4114 TaxID=2817731 RepID=UPI002856DB98|nr:hypothetical protein [Pseudorhodobacter sp. 4114]
MTAPLVFEVALSLKAPFLFPGQDAGRFGYDRVALRDLEGRAIIPQDQIKGLIRHGLTTMGRADLVAELMGKGSADARKDSGGAFEPDKGRMFFTDLHCTSEADTRSIDYHRVKIDDESGAAEQGHLMRLEQVFAPESGVTFLGQITLFPTTATPNEKTLGHILEAALQCKRHIGAMASIGFGEVTGCTLTPVGETETGCKLPAKPHERFLWRFRLDRPYLVDAIRTDNGYIGQLTIPGGALKGLLARCAALRGVSLDAKDLANTVFGHASQYTAKALPLSVACVREKDIETCHDLAGVAVFPDGVTLQIDWKTSHEDACAKAFEGSLAPQSRYTERVHTQIDATTGAAKDENLFSTTAIVPEDADFTAIIDTSALSPEGARAILGALCTPMLGLGRTDARVLSRALVPTKPPVPATGKVALVLQTKAWIEVDSLMLRHDPLSAYTPAFKAFLSNSTLCEVHAAQELVGDYIARQFTAGSRYMPWLVTSSGSVFVLDVNETDQQRLQKLLGKGLCSERRGHTALDWQTCPFVAENGYGAFIVTSVGSSR